MRLLLDAESGRRRARTIRLELRHYDLILHYGRPDLSCALFLGSLPPNWFCFGSMAAMPLRKI
jgi:hypothetical protein